MFFPAQAVEACKIFCSDGAWPKVLMLACIAGPHTIHDVCKLLVVCSSRGRIKDAHMLVAACHPFILAVGCCLLQFTAV